MSVDCDELHEKREAAEKALAAHKAGIAEVSLGDNRATPRPKPISREWEAKLQQLQAELEEADRILRENCSPTD